MKDKWYYKYGWTILEGSEKKLFYQRCFEESVLLVERANLEFESLLRIFYHANERFARRVYATALSRREELSGYQDSETMQQMIEYLSLEDTIPLMKHENPMITALAYQAAIEQVDRGREYLSPSFHFLQKTNKRRRNYDEKYQRR